MLTLFFYIVLIFSAILHEFAHGWMAYYLGDSTAKDAGRLTLNPLPHIDPVGTILMPTLLLLSKAGFFIAWAKPVPYNPYNLRDPKYGDLKVGLAGPGMNLLLATGFGLLARFLPISAGQKTQLAVAYLQDQSDVVLSAMHGSLATSLFVISIIIVIANLVLMLFNLIPIPPLDGSRVVLNLLPYRLQAKWLAFERYSFFILILLIMSGATAMIGYGVLFLLQLIVGL